MTPSADSTPTPHRARPAAAAVERIHWSTFAYLGYLGMLLFQPLFDGGGWRSWLVAAGLVAAFVPVYLWLFGLRRDDPRSRWGLAWFVLLGVVSVGPAWNTGGTVFFVYAAAVAPHVLPRRQAIRTIVGLMLLCALLLPFSPVPFPYRWAVFLPALLFVPFIGMLMVAESDKARADQRLRMAHDEVERLATIAERERIARDLHDLLGHTLSTITLKSELAARLSERDPSRAGREMAEVERISREALQEVREAVRGYRNRGLASEVANAKLALEGAGITFSYRAGDVDLGAQQEGVAALVLREAVTNVLRHSGASRCAVELRREGAATVLIVSDNGVGGALDEGIGLSGIRERLRSVGGRLELVRDGGVTLRATLPGAPRDAVRPVPSAALGEVG